MHFPMFLADVLLFAGGSTPGFPTSFALRSWDHATLRGHGRHATLTRRGLGPWPTVNAEMR